MKNSSLLFLLFVLLQSALFGQISTIESHMMGHSLIDHESPTEETTIAFWIDQFADEASLTYETTGQFGSIWQFAEYNPASEWSYVGVDPSWNNELDSFDAVSLNNFIFTVFNFIQDLPPNVPYYTEPSSVLTASERLLDSLELDLSLIHI